jgi:transcriptional regulator GlxA family with amidase domain
MWFGNLASLTVYPYRTWGIAIMLTVAFVLYPRVLLGSITLPLEMLTAADHFYRVHHKSESHLRVHVATLDGAALGSTGIFSIKPTCALDQLVDIDLLYLPTLWRNPLPVLHGQRRLIPLLQDIASRQALICAVGTGSCFLAEAGLLNGKPATTHWYFLDAFSRRYPDVDLKRRHLITRAGNLYCAGSVNSVADLTCYFVERFYGPQIARQVESHFSPEIRRSYRQQGYFEGEANLQHHDELMVDAQQWLHEHFAEPFRFAEVAQQLGMSQRTLNRRFKLATGMVPGRYLQQLRLEQARELLRDSNLSIAEIAVSVGYQDLGHFSTLFREHMSQSPTAYRQAVRGKLFAVSVDAEDETS